jgi:hypothetical protein
MGIFISGRDIAARNPLIGELRRRICNVYNSDKFRPESYGAAGHDLLGENGIFLNPEGVVHNRIIRGCMGNLSQSTKRHLNKYKKGYA